MMSQAHKKTRTGTTYLLRQFPPHLGTKEGKSCKGIHDHGESFWQFIASCEHIYVKIYAIKESFGTKTKRKQKQTTKAKSYLSCFSMVERDDIVCYSNKET